MIDSTKSPRPAWHRYMMTTLLTVMMIVAGYVIYTKELHHSPSAAPAATPSTAPPANPAQAVTTTTTVPGGIPISPRNPFGD